MPSPQEMQQRIADLAVQREEMISKYGLMVQGVFGGEQAPDFAYTIGLADKGWPELLLVGLRPDYAHQMLNDAATHFVRLERAPVAGDVLENIGNWPVALSPVDPDKAQEYICQALYRAEAKGQPVPTALHMIFPDRAGRWPTDPEYDHEYMDPIQPKLAEQWVCPTERARETLRGD